MGNREGERRRGKGWDQQQKGHTNINVAERKGFTTILQKSQKKRSVGSNRASWGSESGFPSWKEHTL